MIFEEVKNINKIKFKFLEKMSRYGSYLSSLSGSMFDYGYQDILSGEYHHSNFDETLLNDLLNSLKIDNCLIFIGSRERLNPSLEKQLFLDSKEQSEKWYGTVFLEHKLTVKDLRLIKINDQEAKALALRPRNNFITKQQNILNCRGEDQCFTSKNVITPNYFYEDNHIKIFTKGIIYFNKQLDKSFKVPRTDLVFSFI